MANPAKYLFKNSVATIEILAEALKEIMNKPNHEIKNIGIRHGEKRYEVLLSKEEMSNAKDLEDYYCVPPDLRDLTMKSILIKEILTLKIMMNIVPIIQRDSTKMI